MKILGVIFLLVGLLSLFGGLVSPSNAQGGVVFLGYVLKFLLIGTGIYLIKSNSKNSRSNKVARKKKKPVSNK
ncbi:MAG: hypothetical protein U5J95_04730 [Balneolaceae bacterium]|nr:hypothetical protein [Balneolaceae bacterium]